MRRFAHGLLAALAALLAVSAGGCAAGPRPGNIEHVVLVWLKEPGDRAAIARLTATAAAFPEQIDGIVSMSIGTALPGEGDVVDDSFDLAFVMRFRDGQALADYATHPVHVRAVEEVLLPVTARFLVYDVVVR